MLMIMIVIIIIIIIIIINHNRRDCCCFEPPYSLNLDFQVFVFGKVSMVLTEVLVSRVQVMLMEGRFYPSCSLA